MTTQHTALAAMGMLAAMMLGLLAACESTSKVADPTAKLRAELASKDADNVDSLIRAGANVRDADTQGVTMLHLAATNGHKNAVSKLVAAGADVNATDAQGRTPLYIAVSSGHYDTVRTLMAHDADHTIVPKGSPTLLQIARQKGHVKISEALALRDLN